MNPVSHGLTGFLVGNVVAPFSKKHWGISTAATGLLVAGGSLLPDVDAVWLFFRHDLYHSRIWYGHRGATHSLLGGFLLSLLVTGILWIWRTYGRSEWKPLRYYLGTTFLLFVGTVLHCLEDMPTPSGSWQGVPLFFPLSSRFGGWGWIWWHNPYLVRLLIGASLIILCLRGLEKWVAPSTNRFLTRLIPLFALIVLVEEIRFVVSHGIPNPLVQQWWLVLSYWVSH